jgi:hypothetical protein
MCRNMSNLDRGLRSFAVAPVAAKEDAQKWM